MGSSCVASSRQGVTVVIVDGHEGITPIVVAPPLRRLNRCSRRDRRRRNLERERRDVMLHSAVIGLAARVAEREIDEQESRHPCLLDDVAGAPDHHGRDSRCLQPTRSQTHGLVTHRSKWNEQCDVNAVLSTPFAHPVGIEGGLALAVFGRHTEEAMVQRTDRSVVDE